MCGACVPGVIQRLIVWYLSSPARCLIIGWSISRGRSYENEGGRQRIKIAGNAFAQVNLNLIPTDEEQMRLREQDSFMPKGRLKFRSVWELDEAGLFEGYYDFLLGIRARRQFRVSELSNPLRLVIDFKN